MQTGREGGQIQGTKVRKILKPAPDLSCKVCVVGLPKGKGIWDQVSQEPFLSGAFNWQADGAKFI